MVQSVLIVYGTKQLHKYTRTISQMDSVAKRVFERYPEDRQERIRPRPRWIGVGLAWGQELCTHQFG